MSQEPDDRRPEPSRPGPPPSPRSEGMRSIRRAATIALGLLLAQVAAASIFEQSYIYPERAGQNKVRWRNYDWQFVDFLTEPDGQGGVRLYYYDREKEAAELAGAA